VAVGPPVTTRLPLAVHLTVASYGWDRVMLLSFLLRILQAYRAPEGPYGST
jgi:hypothetical protein